jgi:hypothetical protein
MSVNISGGGRPKHKSGAITPLNLQKESPMVGSGGALVSSSRAKISTQRGSGLVSGEVTARGGQYNTVTEQSDYNPQIDKRKNQPARGDYHPGEAP